MAKHDWIYWKIYHILEDRHPDWTRTQLHYMTTQTYNKTYRKKRRKLDEKIHKEQ